MTATIELKSEQRVPSSIRSRFIWVSLLAILAATVANLGLYFAAGSLFPEVTAWSGSGPSQIVGANIVYLLIGAVIFAVMIRISSRPTRYFLIVASFGLLVSLVMPISAGFGYGPPGVPPADTVTVITLSMMHIVSFVISVPMFILLVLDERSS